MTEAMDIYVMKTPIALPRFSGENAWLMTLGPTKPMSTWPMPSITRARISSDRPLKNTPMEPPTMTAKKDRRPVFQLPNFAAIRPPGIAITTLAREKADERSPT